MKYIHKNHSHLKSLFVFFLGFGMAYFAVQAITITPSTLNNMQVIKSIFLSSDGSNDANNSVVSLNHNGQSILVHSGNVVISSGALRTDTICDKNGNSCDAVSKLISSDDLASLTSNTLPYYSTNSGLVDSTVTIRNNGNIGIGGAAHRGNRLLRVHGEASIAGATNINNKLTVNELKVQGKANFDDSVVGKSISTESYLQFVGNAIFSCTGSAHLGSMDFQKSCTPTGTTGTMSNRLAVCMQTGSNNFGWVTLTGFTFTVNECPSGVGDYGDIISGPELVEEYQSA